MSPADISFFRERSHTYEAGAGRLDGRLTLFSILRVAVFAVFVIAVIIAANNSDFTALLISVSLFAVIFPLLVKAHNRLKYRHQHLKFLSKINRDEISRINGKLDQFDEGLEFIDHDHPYHIDLDIFGRNSLFQLLDHTTTYTGRSTLAGWISQKTSSDEIINRQKAVQELRNNIDWLQEFQATGMHTRSKTDTEAFFEWLDEKNQVYPGLFPRIIRYVGPFLFFVLTGWVLFSGLSLGLILLGFVFHGFILLRYFPQIKHVHERTSGAIRALQSFEALIGFIEKREFHTEKLRTVRHIFMTGGHSASRVIGNLKMILQNLDNRYNMMYHVFNFIFLLDLHFALAAEKWKRKQPEEIRNWFKAVGEMESLTSLAAFSAINPEYCFPEIRPGTHYISLINAGHPLIPYSKRVNNDFSLNDRGKVALITGSNMAGKSTFLRTVGINAVLAMAGSPVCAKKMEVSLSQVFTGMRSQDNLEENMSSFYAELDRIRQLLDIMETNDPVLYFLDELLKGTNSHDRHLGAVSLVHQLSGKNAMGLISTHDLELARETSKATWVKNYSFESSIEGDEIYFDYKLHEGISKTLNASKLMEKMGIKLINR